MLPERLQKLRIARRLTQAKLAEELNRSLRQSEHKNSASQIGNWERGERSPDHVEIRKLADFFNVSTDYLIGHSETQNVNLQELFLSGTPLDFGDIKLNANDRFKIYQQIENYLQTNKNTDTINNIPLDYQIELNFDSEKEK